MYGLHPMHLCSTNLANELVHQHIALHVGARLVKISVFFPTVGTLGPMYTHRYKHLESGILSLTTLMPR